MRCLREHYIFEGQKITQIIVPYKFIITFKYVSDGFIVSYNDNPNDLEEIAIALGNKQEIKRRIATGKLELIQVDKEIIDEILSTRKKAPYKILNNINAFLG